jgi:hypothetical protein
VAQEALGRVVSVMNAAGVTDRGDIDCLVAMTAGLIEAQMSNEPGGDRWLRHLNRMIDVLVDNPTEGKPNEDHEHHRRHPHQPQRGPDSRLGRIREVRGPDRLTDPGRVGDRHRLRRLGRPQDGLARPRLRRCPGLPVVFLHQLRRGLALNKEIDSHHWVDGLNELQIRERSALSNDEVLRNSRQSARRRSRAGSALHCRCATPRSRSAPRSAGSR